LLDDRGLVCIGGFETHLAVFADSEARERNHQSIQENAKLLHTLGGANLVVGTDGPEGQVENVLDELAAAFRDVASRTRDFQVNLLLEFNWSPIVKSFRTAVEVAQRSGAENVGVLFDSAHYHCTPTKFDQIRSDTVRWVKGVHVNDMRDKPAELSNCNSDRELPGEGHLNLRELFGRIEECGYNGPFCIEMFSDALWALNPKEASRRMYESMKTML
jgi:sugar phosphate isomerase/epimerase